MLGDFDCDAGGVAALSGLADLAVSVPGEGEGAGEDVLDFSVAPPDVAAAPESPDGLSAFVPFLRPSDG